MGVMSRQREALITNGLEADAGDLDAEFDHIVATHNESETRLVAAESDIDDLETATSDLGDIRTNITELQGEMDDAEAAIAALQDSGITGPPEEINTSATLTTSWAKQVLVNTANVTITLGDPDGAFSFDPGTRFMVMFRASGYCEIQSSYFSPDNDNRVMLRDGDAVLLTVITDTNGTGTKRWHCVYLTSSMNASVPEQITGSTTYDKADLPSHIICTAAGKTVTLPALDNSLIGRKVIISAFAYDLTVACNAADAITVNGSSGAASFTVNDDNTVVMVGGPVVDGTRRWFAVGPFA